MSSSTRRRPSTVNMPLVVASTISASTRFSHRAKSCWEKSISPAGRPPMSCQDRSVMGARLRPPAPGAKGDGGGRRQGGGWEGGGEGRAPGPGGALRAGLGPWRGARPQARAERRRRRRAAPGPPPARPPRRSGGGAAAGGARPRRTGLEARGGEARGRARGAPRLAARPWPGGGGCAQRWKTRARLLAGISMRRSNVSPWRAASATTSASGRTPQSGSRSCRLRWKARLEGAVPSASRKGP